MSDQTPAAQPEPHDEEPEYLTVIHVGGGSTAEAAQAEAVCGPYPDVDAADAAGRRIHAAVRHDSYLGVELFWTVVPIPAGTPDTAVIAELMRTYDVEEPPPGGAGAGPAGSSGAQLPTPWL